MEHSRVDILDDEPPPYPPPAYSGRAESRALENESHRSSGERTFDAIQEKIASSKHSYEVWESGDGLTVHRGGQALYRVAIDVQTGAQDLTMSRSTSLEIVARARLSARQNGDFEVHTGSQNPTEADWVPVRRTRDGGLLNKSDSYRFTVGKRPLVWKKTHASALGSSKFSTNDYKLLDESRVGEKAHPHVFHQATPKVIAGGDPIAVYLQHGVNGATASRHMQINWMDDFGDELETAALITLLGILQRTQDHVRQAGQIQPDNSRQ